MILKSIKFACIAVLAASLVSASCSSDSSAKPGEPTDGIDKSFPVFTPIGGFYREAQTVSISNASGGAIHYTLDGTKPTTDSAIYSAPFAVSKACVIRALAVQSDGSFAYAQTAFDFDLDRSTDYAGTVLDSPNWRDKVIYFLLTDRFYNGNASNDDDGDGFDETTPFAGQPESGFNGGDLAGVRQKLDYIKSLGADAVWITPPVKNQVSEGNYHGYHGYWASDFTETDSHFGSLSEYQSLVNDAHEKNLYVIQDIVVNHTGDFMKITAPVTEELMNAGTLPSSVFSLNANSVPASAPDQLPWKFNDPNLLTVDEFKNSSFYNFKPSITDYTDSSQLLTWQMSDLDDMNTDNPVVQNLLRGYFRYWIDKAGIDGYRIDTVMYVDPSFFEGFINSTEADNQGVREYARQKGKNDFITFGEAWSIDETVVSSYSKNRLTGDPRIDSMIYFPLTFAVRNCLSSGSGTRSISSVLNNRYTVKVGYRDPDRMVTFIDNHDMDRLIMNTDPELVKAAYALIMTLPGVPQIYYGAEQGLSAQRPAMFAGGFECDADAFDETSEWYSFFKDVIALRKSHDVFRYNRTTVLKDTVGTGGLLAYALTGRDPADSAVTLERAAGTRALFVMNNSEAEQVFNVEQNIFLKGDSLSLLQPSSPGYPQTLTASSDGALSFIVPGKSYGVYILDSLDGTSEDTSHAIELTSSYTEVFTGDAISVSGTSTHAGTVKIVKNNDYSNAQEFTVTAGAFQLDCGIASLSNGTNYVEAVLLAADGAVAYSSPVSFKIDRPFVERAAASDPVNDDTGPAGYSYGMPTTTIQPYDGQMDITGVSIKTSGTDMRIEISTRSMTKGWNPTINAFDHVMFTLFFAKPGSTEGCSVHPRQNYTLPGGFAWDYMLKAEGWGSSFYSSQNASATVDGTSVSPSPTSEVDWSGIEGTRAEPGKIVFVVKGASLGYPASLDGWKVYINTYDYDTQKLRGMGMESSEWKFSGGNLETDPLVIDETAALEISL